MLNLWIICLNLKIKNTSSLVSVDHIIHLWLCHWLKKSKNVFFRRHSARHSLILDNQRKDAHRTSSLNWWELQKPVNYCCLTRRSQQLKRLIVIWSHKLYRTMYLRKKLLPKYNLLPSYLLRFDLFLWFYMHQIDLFLSKSPMF